VRFLKAVTIPPVTTLATKQAKQAIVAHFRTAAVVLFANEDKGPLYELFTKTARRYAAAVPFFFTSSPKVASRSRIPSAPSSSPPSTTGRGQMLETDGEGSTVLGKVRLHLTVFLPRPQAHAVPPRNAPPHAWLFAVSW